MAYFFGEQFRTTISTCVSTAATACRQKLGVIKLRLHRLTLLIVFVLCIYFLVYLRFSMHPTPPSKMIAKIPPNDRRSNHVTPDGYLVYSPNCRIPALDPLAPDVMAIFKRQMYAPCSPLPPLTFIQIDETSGVAELLVNTTLLESYNARKNARCCYQVIQRSHYDDSKYTLGECIPIKKNVAHLNATNEFILVRCMSGYTEVYINTHAIVRQRPDIRKRFETFSMANKQQRPLSVLMMAIDSTSRLNLLRAMPKTAQRLHDSGWFELQGYNKVAGHTFPNVLAIMLGYNYSLGCSRCTPWTLGGQDECPFVWKDFRNAGYVTAYGEDNIPTHTFNYDKRPGFILPPTDYYMRPYFLAAEEHLKTSTIHSYMTHCLGYQYSVDHLFQYALDFAETYNNDPFFGLFWTSSFSHHDISDTSLMDDNIYAYLEQMHDRDILNKSAVVLFSDHGNRFGPVTELLTGWQENRMPFMFIWLPRWFREANPDIVRALKINRNRLTSTFDLHVTLKHILNLSGRRQDTLSGAAESCKNCHSMFHEMDPNRSCENASIELTWCTCPSFTDHDKSDSLVEEMVELIVKRMNDDLETDAAKTTGSSKCALLRTRQIKFAAKGDKLQSKTTDVYLIRFETLPNYAFEAMVEHDPITGHFNWTCEPSE